MPTITRLVQGKKNPNRVNLYLDDQFAFALSIDEVAKHSLKKGLELDDVSIEMLKKNDESEYIFAKILNFLSYRPRTVKEVKDRLYKYEVKEALDQDQIIARLQAKGYLDDVAFASWFIDSRNAHRPRSPRMMVSELKSKGISETIIKSVMSQVSPESSTIEKLLTKKLGANRPLIDAEKQKIYAFLSRQGFSWEGIKEVVKSWESE